MGYGVDDVKQNPAMRRHILIRGYSGTTSDNERSADERSAWIARSVTGRYSVKFYVSDKLDGWAGNQSGIEQADAGTQGPRGTKGGRKDIIIHSSIGGNGKATSSGFWAYSPLPCLGNPCIATTSQPSL